MERGWLPPRRQPLAVTRDAWPYRRMRRGATSVDVAAPGSGIYSTYLSAIEGAENCSYATLSGTSMATPMVAGCLALIKAAYPGETYGETIRRLYDAGVWWHSTGGALARVWRADSAQGEMEPIGGWLSGTNYMDAAVLNDKT